MSEYLNMQEYEVQRKTIPVILTYCANIYDGMGDTKTAATIREQRKKVVEGATVNMTVVGQMAKAFLGDKHLDYNYKLMGLEELMPLEAIKKVAEVMVMLWYKEDGKEN